MVLRGPEYAILLADQELRRRISTPARAWSNINSSALSVDKLTHLVLDEADLVLSYGYEDELQKISQALQDKGPQCILMSATLGEDVDKLKEMGFCRNPTLLEIEEVQTGEEAVTQFVVKYVNAMPSPLTALLPLTDLLDVEKMRSSFSATSS